MENRIKADVTFNAKYLKLCCVPNCRGEKHRSFSVPRRKELRLEWLKRIFGKEIKLSNRFVNNLRICSKHFDKICFQSNGKLDNACIPTRYLPGFISRSRKDCFLHQDGIRNITKTGVIILDESENLTVQKPKYCYLPQKCSTKNTTLTNTNKDTPNSSQNKIDKTNNSYSEKTEELGTICILCGINTASINVNHLVQLIKCLADVDISKFGFALRACRICVDEVDIAYKIRHKIKCRSQTITKYVMSRKNKITQTENPCTSSLAVQTDESYPVKFDKGPKLNDIALDLDLLKNLIIIQADQNSENQTENSSKIEMVDLTIDDYEETRKDDYEETRKDHEGEMETHSTEPEARFTMSEIASFTQQQAKCAFKEIAQLSKQCLRCFQWLGDPLSLSEHIRTKCSIKLQQKVPLENVENTIEIDRTCSKCRSIFRTRQDRNTHETYIHNLTMCTICLIYCGNSKKLENHKAMHENEEPIMCKYCYETITKTTEVTHEVVHGLNWWKRMVKSHPKRSVYNDLKNKHYIECETDGTVICETCGEILKNKHILTKHQQLHDKNEFKCDICLREFFTKYLLSRHYATSHLMKRRSTKQTAKTEDIGTKFKNAVTNRINTVSSTENMEVVVNNAQ